MRISTLLFALLLGSAFLKAQEKLPAPISAEQAYRDYVSYTDDENYEDALSALESIQVGDTSYIGAQLDKTLTLINLERYDDAIELCKESIEIPYNPYPHIFRLNWGYALTAKEEYEAAHKVYNDLKRDYPFYKSVRSNIAALYLKEEKYDQSYEAYQEAARLFPFDVNAHYNLAWFAYNEGHLTEAFMAFNLIILLEPYSERSLSVLQLLNEISNNSKTEKIPKEGFNMGSDEYEEIDLLIENYVALSKKYKVPGKNQLYFAKQNHLILSQLVEKKNTDYFYSSYYEPIFEKIMEEGWFEQMQLLELLPSTNENHQKLVEKGMKDIKAFNNWFQDTWYSMNKMHQIDYENLKGEYQVWYYDNGAIQSIGSADETEKKNMGDFCFFNERAVLMSKGKYGAEGKTGVWEYYHEHGKINQKIRYKEGKVIDTVCFYNKAGVIDERFGYANEKKEGFYEEYYRTGRLYRKGANKNDQLDGEMIYYFKNGEVEYKATYSEGKLDGMLTEYYANGNVYREEEFSEGKSNGAYRLFWIEGTKRAEGTKEEGEFVGEYKSYFRNGQLEQVGTLKNGKEEGVWKEYYVNGKPSSVTNYANGKSEGITQYFDYDGILYAEKGFKNGYLISYKFFDKEGNVLSEGASKKKQYTLENFHPNGTLESKGDYKANVGYVGPWESFDKYGNLEYKFTYEDGNLEGETFKYYAWGSKEEEMNYSEGELDGYYASYYPLGQMKEQGYYENGNLIGTWEYYYEDGTLKSRRTYFNNKLEGASMQYAVNGRLDFSDVYEEGILMEGTFFDSLGNELNTFVLENGEGMYEKYHQNKQLAYRGKEILNSDEGEFQWYYSTGQLKSEGSNNANSREGEWKGYHVNGKLRYTGSYVNGGKQGDWVYYYKDGTKQEIEPYQFNKMHGVNINYHDNGTLQSETNYAFGKREGETKLYDYTGAYQMSRVYENDEIVSYFYYDENQKKQAFKVENGTAKVRGKYPNGKPSREFDLVNGYFHGPYKSYYSNGQIETEYELKNGETVGDYKMYYQSGKLMLESFYENDVLEGTVREYYENGTLKEETTYKSGVKHGPSILYTENGNVQKTHHYYDGYLYEK